MRQYLPLAIMGVQCRVATHTHQAHPLRCFGIPLSHGTPLSTQGYRSYGWEEEVLIINGSLIGCHDKRRRRNGHTDPR